MHIIMYNSSALVKNIAFLDTCSFTINKKSFSNTAYLNGDDSSDTQNSSDRATPDLIESRAKGKWDSSTVPDTVSEGSEYSPGRNTKLKMIAVLAKFTHDVIDEHQKDCLEESDLLRRESGQVHQDISEFDLYKMGEKVNSSGVEGQKHYDFFLDEIEKAHDIVKEAAKLDKMSELSSLRALCILDKEKNLDEEEKKINDFYERKDNLNLEHNQRCREGLRLFVDRTDIDLRELDERGEDSENRPENSPKISESSNKRKNEDLGEEESSNKRFKQDSSDTTSHRQNSSDVTSDCEPYDIYSDE